MRFRTHGITRNIGEMEEEPEGPWYYEQLELGYNYRITDIQAALLISQLDKLHLFAARRKEIVERYDKSFLDIPEIVLQKKIPQSDTVQHLYIVQLNLERLNCTRRAFFDAMVAENVVPNVHYIPVYRLPYYQKLGYKRGLCPNAERLYERFITIPLFGSTTREAMVNG